MTPRLTLVNTRFIHARKLDELELVVKLIAIAGVVASVLMDEFNINILVAQNTRYRCRYTSRGKFGDLWAKFMKLSIILKIILQYEMRTKLTFLDSSIFEASHTYLVKMAFLQVFKHFKAGITYGGWLSSYSRSGGQRAKRNAYLLASFFHLPSIYCCFFRIQYFSSSLRRLVAGLQRQLTESTLVFTSLTISE